jgi:hypothetical protein
MMEWLTPIGEDDSGLDVDEPTNLAKSVSAE